MTVKEAVSRAIDGLSEDRLRQLLDYAQFLQEQEEKAEWRRFGRTQFARAYGPDEPKYTEADVRSEPPS
jgi:hypothetical protein